MGKATDEEAKESLGFQDVALTLSSSDENNGFLILT